MKGITPLLVVIGLLALVLIFFNKPGSVLDDCSRIPFIGAHMQYNSMIESYHGRLWAYTNIGTETSALVIENVPENVEIESAQLKTTIATASNSANNMWIGTTSYVNTPHGRCPAQKAYIISAPAGDLRDFNDKRIDGYYDAWYIVKFKAINIMPTATPSFSILPIPIATPASVPQEGKIFILSDIFDGVKSIIAGIIAFVAIPFIPPAP